MPAMHYIGQHCLTRQHAVMGGPCSELQLQAHPPTRPTPPKQACRRQSGAALQPMTCPALCPGGKTRLVKDILLLILEH